MRKPLKVPRGGPSRPFFALMFFSMVFAAATVAGYSVSAIDYMLEDGVIFRMSDTSKMKVQLCTDKIVRVVYTKQATIPKADQNYIVVKGTWAPERWTINKSATAYTVQTATVRVDIAIATGLVSFYAGGNLILQETAPKKLMPVTIADQTAYQGTLEFNSPADEGIYGFGQFQSGNFNQRPVFSSIYELVQRNQTDCSPVFLSTRGFGILWINYSRMTVLSALHLTCDWATNDAIDYYFMYGPEFDTIIASYRTITGPAPLWPKWAYGFWQCKNRYQSQYEIINAVQTYRSKNYPIDNIVQDWQYYAQGMSGCACFDALRFPDPAKMIDTLHDSLHCHFTISVWPSFAASDYNKNWQFMANRGYLLATNDYLGQTYDPFNDSAAYYYWNFIDTGLVKKGADAFWPDATEPESYGWANCNTAQGPATKVLNIFPLLHSKCLYDGFRNSKWTGGKKRVCNLTRSYYAGSQRFGAAYWTGDVQIALATYRAQIPAGLNVCATGLPYFCTDIGGFTGETDAAVLVRWFQWGAFNPVFRIHGTRSTELWNPPQAAHEQILVNYSRLRYRLFPYVYSLAWKVTSEGYTMMRGLPFDFRTDGNVRDITDEFMFGPALLICPVTSTIDPSRNVYLPAGKWYDFWTADTLVSGVTGRTINVPTPLETMPIYVRAGSILPMGPEITYADMAADPIEIRVYTGANGSLTMYEDEGNSYNYEQGVYATIPITWNEASQNLFIGPTSGTFPGMLENRTFNVVWVSHNHGTGEAVTPTIDSLSITYRNNYMITLNKSTGNVIVGVKEPPAMPKGAWFTAHLQGRKYVVRVAGNKPWEISIIDLKGRVIAVRDVQGGASCVMAERLAPGVYCVKFTYDKAVSWKRTIAVQ